MTITAAADRAATLVEALPWLARFHGSIAVIKYGGHAMLNTEVQRAFAADLVFLRYVGIKPVVVHGGGKEIDTALHGAGIPKRQVEGLRITDGPTLDVVVAVLAGAINTRLVAALRKAGARPLGLTGADASVATMKRSGATSLAPSAAPTLQPRPPAGLSAK